MLLLELLYWNSVSSARILKKSGGKSWVFQLIWSVCIKWTKVLIWERFDRFLFFFFSSHPYVELTRKHNEAIHGYIFPARDDTAFLCKWIFSEKQHRLWACSSVQRCQGINFEDLGKPIHLCILPVSTLKTQPPVVAPDINFRFCIE